MSSNDHQRPDRRSIDWPAILRTLLVQVVVLLALAGAFIAYIDWSSDATWAEFIDAGKASVTGSGHRPQLSIPVHTVKGQQSCNPKG